MDIFSSLECLDTKDIISSEQSQALKKIAGLLPSSVAELMQVIAAISLSRQNNDNSFTANPIGSESITSTGIADIKVFNTPLNSRRAMITVFDNNIIFRFDGGNPAMNTGHFSSVGSNFLISGLSDFKFISFTGSATIFVTYF